MSEEQDRPEIHKKISKALVLEALRNGLALKLYNLQSDKLDDTQRDEVSEIISENAGELLLAMAEVKYRSDPEQRVIVEARKKLFSTFLQQVLIPRVMEGEAISDETLEHLHLKFREENPGPGSDFELSNVWGSAFGELDYDLALSQKDLIRISADYPLAKAFFLLSNYLIRHD